MHDSINPMAKPLPLDPLKDNCAPEISSTQIITKEEPIVCNFTMTELPNDNRDVATGPKINYLVIWF